MTYFKAKIASSLDDLAKKRQMLTLREKTVLTSGCFDLLHRGHLQYLCDASKQGFLIVGVNSDSFVRRLKGKTRTIREQNDRLFTVAGFEPVRLAVVFDDDVAFIRAAKPDIYIAFLKPHTFVSGRIVAGSRHCET